MAVLDEPNAGGGGAFQATQWSLILAARQPGSPQGQQALERLCQAYWFPIYAFIRRRGHDSEPARDLTQEFFSRLLAKEYLRIADQERGRFRSFLLSCVDHFLCNERKKEGAIKRGGEVIFISLQDLTAEDQYQQEPAEEWSPDRLLDRRWALTVLELALQQLRQEYAEGGKSRHFEVLEAHLSGAREAPCSFAEAGAQLGMTEAAARQAASRMRARFGAIVRRTVAQTVASPQDLEEELAHLRHILSTG